MTEAVVDRWARGWRLHAAWGGLLFGALCIVQPLTGLRAVGGIGYLLTFAALVIVPLGASLADMPRRDGTTMALYRVAVFTHPLAALAAVTALHLPVGMHAALLAGMWLLQTLVLAGFGAYRLACHGVGCLDELAIDVGLLHLPIGGAWWVATCAGWGLGFTDLIVQLTAIHFHYAGFAAPLICGLTGRGIEPSHRRLRRIYRAACWTVMLGVWIVAAGIGVSSIPQVPIWASAPIELAGTLLLASGMVLLAALLIFHLTRRAAPTSSLLFAIAGLSLALPMTLAVGYVAGRVIGWPVITIPEMARWHGMLNAIGFAGAGLLGFALWRPASRGARRTHNQPTR